VGNRQMPGCIAIDLARFYVILTNREQDDEVTDACAA
jgi:hypothetical protein